MSTATRTFAALWSSGRGRSGRERTLRQMLADYRDAGAGSSRKVALVVFLAANGLLEGLALAALIPALNAGFASSAEPGFLGRLLGAGPGANPDTVILRSIVLFAILGVGSALATFVVGRLTIQVRYQIEADLRRKMTRALLDMPWLPFLEMRLGDITKTVLLDGSQAAIGVVSLLQAVGATAVTGVFLVVALAISVPMTLFTLAFGAVAVLAYKRASARASAHSAELSSVTDELSRETTEVFGGFKYVRATGLAEEAWSRTAALVEKFRDKSVKSMTPSTVVRFLYEGSGILFVAWISSIVARCGFGPDRHFTGLPRRLLPACAAAHAGERLAVPRAHPPAVVRELARSPPRGVGGERPAGRCATSTAIRLHERPRRRLRLPHDRSDPVRHRPRPAQRNVHGDRWRVRQR